MTAGPGRARLDYVVYKRTKTDDLEMISVRDEARNAFKRVKWTNTSFFLHRPHHVRQPSLYPNANSIWGLNLSALAIFEEELRVFGRLPKDDAFTGRLDGGAFQKPDRTGTAQQL